MDKSQASLANKLKQDIKDNTSLVKWFETSSRNDMQTLYVSAIYNFVNRGKIIDDKILSTDISIAINSINNNIKYLVDKYKEYYTNESLNVKQIYKICVDLLTDTTGNLLMKIITNPKFNIFDPQLILTLDPQSQLIIKTKNIIARKMTLLKFSSDLLFTIPSMNSVTNNDDKLIANDLLKSNIFSMGCVDYVKGLRVDDSVVALLDILRNNQTIIDTVENKSGEALGAEAEEVSEYATDGLGAEAEEVSEYATDGLGAEEVSEYATDGLGAEAEAAEDAVVDAMAAVVTAADGADDMPADVTDMVMDHSIPDVSVNQQVFDAMIKCFTQQPTA